MIRYHRLRDLSEEKRQSANKRQSSHLMLVSRYLELVMKLLVMRERKETIFRLKVALERQQSSFIRTKYTRNSSGHRSGTRRKKKNFSQCLKTGWMRKKRGKG